MGRFYGKVGYVFNSETTPGVWEPTIVERNYFGDINRNSRRLQDGESTNDNVTLNNEISIVADPYALQNFHAIRYTEWMGTRWKVSSVDVQYPRLVLSFGGVYNGPVPKTETT